MLETVALYLTRSWYVSSQQRDFGIQEASRNWTEPSLTPGPRVGTVAHTSNKEVAITVTQIK